jgi:predicted RNA-binding protein YlqC (UPF0109 family)
LSTVGSPKEHALSSPKEPSLSFRSGSQEELRGNESRGNESTAASSICDSPAADCDSSTKVLFAKASELIRIEIAAVERRMTARVEAERADRKKICDKMGNDLEALVTIVEGLSAQADRNSSSSVDVLIEEERQLRDMSCASLHGKLETLASQIQSLQSNQKLVHIKEDCVDILFDQEGESRNALERSLQANDMEQDRESSPGLDDQYLNALLAKEAMAREVALATLRKELRQELEAMAMDVRSMAVRVPLFDLLEKQQKELQAMYGKLREDVQAMDFEELKMLLANKAGMLRDGKDKLLSSAPTSN